ncbi:MULTISPECIES: hypothetical protein [Aeromonas]|jgi:hypothetical protein|uniref:hypothetical protein n=1 Tax=Aeromonas TaxID=642 RepID=UPI000946C5EA|nr:MULTISPECIES: hypothetical protein [Aeromonas]MDM5103831.1 hypothetical protein [Aeromonas salmonicida]OLF19961.1 hypothetical protein BSP75_19535 [Aeromonas sp. YN13HZO-058]TNH83501.1 hypothetical protein CF140_09890 [Aeromonas sobria]TNI77400.1 hypothetical protein CF119_21935 [Aeromonas sobria]
MTLYDVGLIIALSILAIGVFLGAGNKRKIVVFMNYDDLGLTFLIPTAFFAIAFMFQYLGGSPQVGAAIGGVVSLVLLFKVIVLTYHTNNRQVGYTCLALITKIPLSILWVLNIIQLIAPSGKTAAQRRSNRQSAMLVLLIVTPIIGLLVVDKSGSMFNPKAWLSGQRIGSIRNHM